MSDDVARDDAYWQGKLSPEEFKICRQKGTERAFSGAYWNQKAAGTYTCKCCGTPLFDSTTKYDSGSGWPSFYQPYEQSRVREHRDRSLIMERTEIVCAKCDCHLGHVFPDGPQPTGMRYCVNSASLNFEQQEDKQEK